MLRSMTLDAATVRRIADITHTDRRSVRAVAAGKYVRGRAGDRIRTALTALGIEVPTVAANPQREAA